MSRMIELPSLHQGQTSADFLLVVASDPIGGVTNMLYRFRIGVERAEALGDGTHRLTVRVPETPAIPAEQRLGRALEVLKQTDHPIQEISRERL